jgi:predicted CxxxxCH...CXXCH cytochrome family protein
MPVADILLPVSFRACHFWVCLLVLAACDRPVLMTNEHTGGAGSSAQYHPEGWAAGDVHGTAAKYQEQACRSCHGDDLSGGMDAVDCASCHESDWQEDCTYCHGGTDNSTGAPPTDISGESATELLSFQAHSAHVSTHWHEGYACEQCHAQPTSVLSSGHLFVDDSTAGVAEVQFESGLSSSASYGGEGSCSNLYCHGDGQTSDGEIDHTATGLSCVSCHADASGTESDWEDMSGKHKLHIGHGAVCANCHGTTVDGDQTIIDPALHVNGTVDLALDEEVAWTASSRTCDGECHLGTHTKDHQGKRWD